jgi:MFS family permease
VDELIPDKVRGTVDLIVNSTFWIGASLGAMATYFRLHAGSAAQQLGWRFACGIGGVLGAMLILLRLGVPESPRWLMLRRHEEEANRIVTEIGQRVALGRPDSIPKAEGKLKITVRDRTPWDKIFRNMTGYNRSRSMWLSVS